MNFGYHLLAWRRQQDLTQDELAAKAHLTRPYVSRLEKGAVDPALSSLRRLAAALGIGLAQLVEDVPPQKHLGRQEMVLRFMPPGG